VSQNGNDRVDLWLRVDGDIIWCDLTVTDPCCPSIVDAAAESQGAAVRIAESKKRSQWGPLADEMGAKVVPLAFETSGLRGGAVDDFFRDMAGSSAVGPSLLSLVNQLSVTMMKFNVAMVREAGKHATGVRPSKRRFARRRPHWLL
jgi:hypothetical protein